MTKVRVRRGKNNGKEYRWREGEGRKITNYEKEHR
jgi:hypothetical protein